ncbi:hypothetical protein FPZ12_043030 [Amycolatopsis acidicola]|uniref:Uncharacterized protein n=1 Tax=Amycolatopsis acidicola TaxID=2596893 RepID=A0A5N0UN25_9PSEU|nr:hypothetical protein [Amycolatopsis acidicola]KAA9149567.1 hypothetical protein FPZ12_043030 [Amycolatopsis acidicola]
MRSTPLPTGFGFPLGFATAIAVTLGTIAAGVTRQPGWSVFALAVVVAAAGVLSTPMAAAGTALVAWGLHDGFVLGRAGDLVFTSGSAVAAGVFAGVAGVLAMTRIPLPDKVKVPAPRRASPVVSVRSSGAGASPGMPAPPRGGPRTRSPW